jgi:hypothetical protein
MSVRRVGKVCGDPESIPSLAERTASGQHHIDASAVTIYNSVDDCQTAVTIYAVETLVDFAAPNDSSERTDALGPIRFAAVRKTARQTQPRSLNGLPLLPSVIAGNPQSPLLQ